MSVGTAIKNTDCMSPQHLGDDLIKFESSLNVLHIIIGIEQGELHKCEYKIVGKEILK